MSTTFTLTERRIRRGIPVKLGTEPHILLGDIPASSSSIVVRSGLAPGKDQLRKCVFKFERGHPIAVSEPKPDRRAVVFVDIQGGDSGFVDDRDPRVKFTTVESTTGNCPRRWDRYETDESVRCPICGLWSAPLRPGMHSHSHSRSGYERLWGIFPPPEGIQLLGQGMSRSRDGQHGTYPQMLLWMDEGTSFRVHRHGRVAGARRYPVELFIFWDGRRLLIGRSSSMPCPPPY